MTQPKSDQVMPTHRTDPSLLPQQIKVALVGCGGNGSMMLTRLARLDYALRACGREGLSVVVFDPDTVSPTNVGRQCFSPADIGQNKAAVCVHRINAFYGTVWHASPIKYPGYLQGFLGIGTRTAPDVLISCVDTAKARRVIAEQFSYTAPRYWLDLGNNRLDGQIVLGQPKQSLFNTRQRGARLPTVVEIFPEILDANTREKNEPTCSVAEALDRQSLFINDHISTWAAQLLDDLLRIGELKWHGAFVNLENGRVNPLPVPSKIEVQPDPQVLAEE